MQYLRPILMLILFCAICLIAVQAASAQAFASLPAELKNIKLVEPPVMRPTPALIIENFISAETRFREALIHFSFKRDVVLQTLDANGEVSGEYLRNSTFVLDDQGQRIEQVLFHPRSTIKDLKITKEDIQDLAGSQLFGIELDQLNSYNVVFLGADNSGSRSAYILSLTLNREPDPHRMRSRFFVGRVWIDALTFQPIKLEGVTVPYGKQRFPLFQTERNLKIENLSFPSSTRADDVLHFPEKDIRYRITIRYYDFKRFSSSVRITEMK